MTLYVLCAAYTKLGAADCAPQRQQFLSYFVHIRLLVVSFNPQLLQYTPHITSHPHSMDENRNAVRRSGAYF